MKRLLIALLLTASARAQFDEASLKALDAKIRAGEFKKITSVLVAHEGKLVHESYFDEGGAEALRNTRSVTKSVTGMLAGIAIDRGALKGVDVRVFPFFAARPHVQLLHRGRVRDRADDRARGEDQGGRLRADASLRAARHHEEEVGVLGAR